MKKIIDSAVKKILNKKQQKAIVGGMCPGGGYPRICRDGQSHCPLDCFCADGMCG